MIRKIITVLGLWFCGTALAGCVTSETSVAQQTITSAGSSITQPNHQSESQAHNQINIDPVLPDGYEVATQTNSQSLSSNIVNAVVTTPTVSLGRPVALGTSLPEEGYILEGVYSQGGVLFGQTVPGAKVTLDGKEVHVDDQGLFVLGFGRDSKLDPQLKVVLPDDSIKFRTLNLADKSFPESRIDGLDQSKVSGFSEEQLKKIRADQALKEAARAKTQERADWQAGFEWPVTGRISGVFGSRRILNGEPKRPHSGVDIARPTGTPIRAPAAGVITLAEHGMYFEGGLVLLDHGHWLESAFLHMSRIDVEPGQRVEKGEIIGAVGATGRVTGPHLHWSVRWLAFNRLVDPQLLVGEMPGSK